MKRLLSGRSSTCSRLAGSVKLGQTVPESNLVSEENSSVPQQTQWYMPAVFSSTYGPVKARSVPALRVTSNCSGVSCSRHSASDLLILVVIWLLSVCVQSTPQFLRGGDGRAAGP